MFDDRTNLAQQVTQELRQFFANKVFNTTIPRNVRLAEAPSYGKPALLYDVRSRGAESYIRLAKEIMDRIQAAKVSEISQINENQVSETSPEPIQDEIAKEQAS